MHVCRMRMSMSRAQLASCQARRFRGSTTTTSRNTLSPPRSSITRRSQQARSSCHPLFLPLSPPLSPPLSISLHLSLNTQCYHLFNSCNCQHPSLSLAPSLSLSRPLSLSLAPSLSLSRPLSRALSLAPRTRGPGRQPCRPPCARGRAPCRRPPSQKRNSSDAASSYCGRLTFCDLGCGKSEFTPAAVTLLLLLTLNASQVDRMSHAICSSQTPSKMRRDEPRRRASAPLGKAVYGKSNEAGGNHAAFQCADARASARVRPGVRSGPVLAGVGPVSRKASVCREPSGPGLPEAGFL